MFYDVVYLALCKKVIYIFREAECEGFSGPESARRKDVVVLVIEII